MFVKPVLYVGWNIAAFRNAAILLIPSHVPLLFRPVAHNVAGSKSVTAAISVLPERRWKRTTGKQVGSNLSRSARPGSSIQASAPLVPLLYLCQASNVLHFRKRPRRKSHISIICTAAISSSRSLYCRMAAPSRFRRSPIPNHQLLLRYYQIAKPIFRHRANER